jgi:hypothetical protein
LKETPPVYDLPEPPATTTGQADNPLTDSVMQAAVRDLIAQASYRNDDPAIPSHKDGPRVGSTPHVPQPDSRIVPPWALGIAVASIGVGAGITGVGCGVWLACQGFAAITLTGVLFVTLPLAGLAMAATAIGGVISKLKQAAASEIHNHNGDEYHEHHTDNRRSVWSKTVNKH